ncbi:YetF domain-containing protein [Heliobacterium mobile]|nr:DUF421 domain-containing protein [Heliobacterium mobile]
MEILFFTLIRSIVIFLLLMLLTRIAGKKLISQMTYFDFATSIVIGAISAQFISRELHGWWVLLAPIFIIIFAISIDKLTLKSLSMRKILDGNPVVVIQNGKILEANMAKVRYNINDLEMQLREKGVFNLTEVEFAILEPHGHLSVLKKTQYQPVTMKDLRKPTSYMGLASEIIKDGDLLEQNLRQNNLSFSWLYKQLREKGINQVEDVFYASLETDGTLYIDMKNDTNEFNRKIHD